MPDGDQAEARGRMVDRLERRGYCERDSTAAAMRAVPRHAFVPADRRAEAYADRPLPIGDGQTISAPHMVAMMVDLLSLESGDRVLEIGTGCGYHAAVVAEVVGAEHVFSVELSPTLAEAASDRLSALGYSDISINVGDGALGWPEHAPYDAAYLTCAAPELPPAVVDQVRPGGRVLAPVGMATQELVLAVVGEEGVSRREHHGGVRFVPLRGDADGGWPRG